MLQENICYEGSDFRLPLAVPRIQSLNGRSCKGQWRVGHLVGEGLNSFFDACTSGMF